MSPLAVIAIGGNAIIKDEKYPNIPDEYAAVGETCQHIVKLIKQGWEITIVHGNGPQVGFNLRRSELAAQELFEIPLDVCVTFTQGSIGYYFQQNLFNLLQHEGITKPVLTIVAQVEVDAEDPAFEQPSKSIGSFLTHLANPTKFGLTSVHSPKPNNISPRGILAKAVCCPKCKP